ncbi:MAG TPA: AAA family ATPase, partial [Ktedonobacteraceae bacterium]|nr:AAA family ATPase [Ktedonobacteraceae bacterium]
MAISIDTSVVSPVLIGREATLTSLENIFAQARAGQGKLVYLSGEAGVGKSRLVAEVRSRFERENACILQGACFEQDIDLPFSPLVDLLRTLLNPASRQETLPKLLPFAPEILKILPELRFWLPEQRPSAPLEPEQEKRRLFVTLANFLLEQAGERVLVLIIEDLHWSDDTSLEFLSFLRRYLGARSFLLLLTYRSEERLPALQRFLVGLDRERSARKIVLEPLTAEEVQAMVRSIFRMKKPVRRDFMEALYQLTEGNPFFVEEVLKSLLARGEIFFAGGIWDRKPLTQLHIPGSIFDAVQQRISLLGEAEREMLSLAAVLGRKVDIALLQALMGYAEVELMKGIEILIVSQLLVDISGEQCEFRHALIQQSVYQGLLALKRKSLHLKIAKTIAQIYASSLDAHMADLAYHYYQAQEWEQAQEYARKAGERALALFSSRAALDQLTRAIEAASHLSQVDTIALYHLRGQAHEFLGNFEESQLDFEQMLLAARATGDRVAEWDGLMDIGILWTGRDLRRAGEFFQRAYNLSQTLSDPQRYLSSHMRLANWKFNVGEAETAIEMYENILDTLRTPERRPVLAIALADLALAYGFYGD